MIYVHHHLGLGDHIVCNAIVRNLYKKYGKLMLAVKKHNYESIKNLYNDLHIEFHVVNSDADCVPMYSTMPFIRIGFENCRSDWEQSFYDQVGLPYEKRFSDFFISRNFEKENNLKDTVAPKEDYCFCNISASTGKYDIPINTKLQKVYLSPVTDSIFDWLSVIESAKEIHTIDSSVFQLIKQLKLNCRKVFYDIRALDRTRSTPSFEDSSWEIVVL